LYPIKRKQKQNKTTNKDGNGCGMLTKLLIYNKNFTGQLSLPIYICIFANSMSNLCCYKYQVLARFTSIQISSLICLPSLQDMFTRSYIPSYVRSAISWRVCASGLINPKSYFYVSSKFLKMHIPSFCHQSVPRSKVFVSVSILANTRHYTIKKLFSLDQLYMLIQGLFLLI